MIKTRKQYEELGKLVMWTTRDYQIIFETIEALREVARWAKAEAPKNISLALLDALESLPDWITENENP